MFVGRRELSRSKSRYREILLDRIEKVSVCLYKHIYMLCLLLLVCYMIVIIIIIIIRKTLKNNV